MPEIADRPGAGVADVGARLAWAAFWWSRVHGPLGRRAALHLLIALPVLLLAIWISTGSLAPYSAAVAPRDMLECGYTGNVDHGHFYEAYLMLRGEPVSEWGDSQMLRRLLYPMMGYPFFRTFGFYVGGLIFNGLLYAATLVLWGYFLFRTVGRRGAVTGIWLLATFPGVAYFAGLPYAYASIVPATAAGLVLLHALTRRRTLRGVALCGLGLGALSQAYDLIVFFGPAALALLVWLDRRPLAFGALVAGIAVPFAVTYGLLTQVFEVPALANENTAVYGHIVQAYLDPLRGTVDWAAWRALLADAPRVVARNLFDATFAALPALLVVLLALAAARRRVRVDPASLVLLATIAAVAVFNNVAPPYEGWQLRGLWIARLYLPAFAPMIFLVALQWRALDAEPAVWRVAGGAAIVLACGFQAAVVGGGLVANASISNGAYVRFYAHNGPQGYTRHLETYGRRPFGFCLPLERQSWPRLKQVPDR